MENLYEGDKYYDFRVVIKMKFQDNLWWGKSSCWWCWIFCVKKQQDKKYAVKKITQDKKNCKLTKKIEPWW